MAEKRKSLKVKKAETREKYNIKIPAQKAGESSFAYSQRLSKMADTRLRRLEALAKEPGYENVTKWAYARAMKDIQTLYGGGTTFQRRAKKTKTGQYNEKQIQAQIAAAKRFLGSVTSTKGNIKKAFKKRADTINKEYGTDFTWEELAKFFQSGLFDKLDRSFGSVTMLKSIGTIQKNDLKTIADIEKYSSSHITESDDAVVMQTTRNIISEYGKDVEKVFFS